MAELPFWDEECLRGSIDRGPLPPPPRSLFESDLFCNEDVENDPLPPPDISPENDFLFNNQDAFSSPARAPLSPTPFLSSPPPLTRPPPPFAMSPIRPLADTPPRPGWKSFLDDNCPLRKRVKVTITQSARARRSLGLFSPEPPAKKPRLASPPRDNPAPQFQPHVPRRRQATLRLSRSGDLAGRIMLHLPSSSSVPSSPPPNQTFSCKQLNLRSKHTNSRSNNQTELTMEDKLHNLAFGPAPEQDLEPEPELSERSESEPELDLEVALEQDFDSDTCAKLEENCSFAETLERTMNTLPDDSSSRRVPNRAIPAKNKRRQRAQRNACITRDLSRRLSSLTKKLTITPSPRQEPGLMTPLVGAAVQAVTRAAQTYNSLLTKVSTSPPAVVFADAWRSPRVPASEQRQVKRARPARAAGGKKVGKIAVKRKRYRRRRTLLSFDDHVVEPLHDGRIEELHSQMDDNSALANYLDSPTSRRTEALAC